MKSVPNPIVFEFQYKQDEPKKDLFPKVHGENY